MRFLRLNEGHTLSSGLPVVFGQVVEEGSRGELVYVASRDMTREEQQELLSHVSQLVIDSGPDATVRLTEMSMTFHRFDTIYLP